MSEDNKTKGPQRFADPQLDLKRLEPLNPDERPPLDEETLEEGWAEEREEETAAERRWSLTWVSAMAVGLVAATIVIASIYGSRPTKEPEAERPYRTAAEREVSAREALVGFLNAAMTSERLEHILTPEQLDGAVDDYYRREGRGRIELRKLIDIKHVELNEHPWVWIKFTDGDGATHVAAMKETPTGHKLDWESFVAYGEMSWERFCAERPTEPTQMRVYLAHSSYYNFKYGDQSEYAAFEIESRETGPRLYGYVRRDGAGYRPVAGSVVPGTRQPMNVKMRFEPDAGADNLVVIDELVHSLWMSPDVLGSQPRPGG